MTIKVLLRFRLKERVVHSIGFTQKKDKLEFARRAGGQVVTSVVCNRSAFGYRSVSVCGSIN